MSDATLPAGFVVLDRTSPYIQAMGPFYWKVDAKQRIVAIRAEEKHINSRGFVHGGVLCGLADLAIGYNLAFLQEPPLPLVTANLTVDFAGAARLARVPRRHPARRRPPCLRERLHLARRGSDRPRQRHLRPRGWRHDLSASGRGGGRAMQFPPFRDGAHPFREPRALAF